MGPTQARAGKTYPALLRTPARSPAIGAFVAGAVADHQGAAVGAGGGVFLQPEVIGRLGGSQG